VLADAHDETLVLKMMSTIYLSVSCHFSGGLSNGKNRKRIAEIESNLSASMGEKGNSVHPGRFIKIKKISKNLHDVLAVLNNKSLLLNPLAVHI